MKESKYLIQRPGGVVLKAIQELSGDKKGWVSLKNVYTFIDDFFGYVSSNEPALDLARFENAGWIKPMNYIPSLEMFVYLTERGTKNIENGIIPEYAENDFYESLNKTRDSAT